MRSPWIIALALSLALLPLAPPAARAQPAQTPSAEGPALRPDAPDRYVVVPGDTLWSIAGRFLKDPWRWNELWSSNKDQVSNPNRIFPGDVIVLNRKASPGEPAARVVEADRTVRLSPSARVQAVGPAAIPAIPPHRIEPFLVKPFIVEDAQVAAAATIIETQENRVVIGSGNIAYVRGITEAMGRDFQIFRPSGTLRDPETGEALGLEALYLGDARLVRRGDVSTIEIVRSTQEIVLGDRLLPAPPTRFPEYIPRPPAKSVGGRVLGVYGRANVVEVARYDVVTLNRGARDGLEVGHVLALSRNPLADRANSRPQTLWGRVGPTGSDAAWDIQRQPREEFDMANPRGQALWGRVGPSGSDRPFGAKGPDVRPTQDRPRPGEGPDERYGMLMVFRTFDRVSYAIIMETSRPVYVNDQVRNP